MNTQNLKIALDSEKAILQRFTKRGMATSLALIVTDRIQKSITRLERMINEGRQERPTHSTGARQEAFSCSDRHAYAQPVKANGGRAGCADGYDHGTIYKAPSRHGVCRKEEAI